VPALPGDRAARVLAEDIEAFERAGCRLLERRGSHEAILEAPRGVGRIVVRLTRVGRIFGGNWGLEVAPEEALLPATDVGLAARGRGVVKQHGVRFRARRRGDARARRLGEMLSGNSDLGDALGRVHFERLWVRRDGRPVIRHLGGSVVWVLFPPIVRTTPLPPGQPEEMLRAIQAFRAAGQEAMKTDPSSV
jgi:Protein of unknown function (DUF3156)